MRFSLITSTPNEMYAFNPFIFSKPSIIYPQGRVASYNFDNGNANDLIGGHNGVSTNIDFTQNGKIGKCAYFDRSGGIIIPSTLPSPSNVGFTFSCFVKNNAILIGYAFYRQSNNDNHNSFISIRIASNMEVGIRGVNGIYNQISSVNSELNDNKYHHIALTINLITGVVCIFIDGALNNSINIASTSINFDSKASLGQWLHDWEGTSGGEKYFGYLDEINIWNRALTSEEITSISSF